MTNKLSNVDIEYLNSLAPVTRKLVFYKLQNEDISLDEILFFTKQLNNFENNMKSTFIARMKREHFSDTAADLFMAFQNKNVNSFHLYTETKKLVSASDDKQIKTFFEILEPYYLKMKNFNNFASEQVKSQDLQSILEKAKENAEKEANDDEDRLFIINTLKHLQYKQKQKLSYPLSILKLALNTSFSDEMKIIELQKKVVIGTYSYIDYIPKDDPNWETDDNFCYKRIQQITYNFIGSVLQDDKLRKYIDGNIISFLFKDDNVSPQTAELLCRSEKYIDKAGLKSYVFLEAKKLHDKAMQKIEKDFNEDLKPLLTVYSVFYMKELDK